MTFSAKSKIKKTNHTEQSDPIFLSDFGFVYTGQVVYRNW